MVPFYAQDHDYSKYNVLAVDDIPLNLLLVQKMLSRFNFTLRTASNGQQALDAVAAQKPDLILLDLMMPGIDGFEVIRRLRENPDTADIQIIMKPIIMEKLLSCVVTQMQLVEAKKR